MLLFFEVMGTTRIFRTEFTCCNQEIKRAGTRERERDLWSLIYLHSSLHAFKYYTNCGRDFVKSSVSGSSYALSISTSWFIANFPLTQISWRIDASFQKKVGESYRLQRRHKNIGISCGTHLNVTYSQYIIIKKDITVHVRQRELSNNLKSRKICIKRALSNKFYFWKLYHPLLNWKIEHNLQKSLAGNYGKFLIFDLWGAIFLR